MSQIVAIRLHNLPLLSRNEMFYFNLINCSESLLLLLVLALFSGSSEVPLAFRAAASTEAHVSLFGVMEGEGTRTTKKRCYGDSSKLDH